MIALVTTGCLAALALAALLCVTWVGRAQVLPDRVVALEVLLTVLVGSVTVWIVRTGYTAFLDVLVVAALVSFVGSVSVAGLLWRDRR